MKSVCALIAVTIVLGACVHPVGATVIVDPDAFASGTDISTAYPGVTLSASGSNVSTASVFSNALGVASTGTQAFFHDGSQQSEWSDTFFLFRADFAQLVTSVSIDIISNNGRDPGFLRAFNSSNVQVGIFNTIGTLGAGTVETASITRVQNDIAYIEAAGLTGQTVHLDNLTFVSTVPEPSTLAIWLVLGGLGCVAARRRRKA